MRESAEKLAANAAEYKIQYPDFPDIDSPEATKGHSEPVAKSGIREPRASDRQGGQVFFLGLDGASFLRYSPLTDVAEEGTTTG